MTTLPKFTFRRDDGGFIVHVSGTDRYFHANAAAEPVLTQLQRGEAQTGVPGAEGLAAVLCGNRERLLSVTEPLSVTVGDVG